jgi:hypothetical protein
MLRSLFVRVYKICQQCSAKFETQSHTVKLMPGLPARAEKAARDCGESDQLWLG